METAVKTKSRQTTEKQLVRKKSKTTLFWEKYPDGLLVINDMRAVLR
ncbi:MAG: hypothetical protein LBN95_00980 [Prevotellaceae bacterium]|jgi:hypothetical protein|nr:hypothetical protein [Prevotellaceae bacterium]